MRKTAIKEFEKANNIKIHTIKYVDFKKKTLVEQEAKTPKAIGIKRWAKRLLNK